MVRPDQQPVQRLTKAQLREQQRAARTQARETATAQAITRRRFLIWGSAALTTTAVVGSGAVAFEHFTKPETQEQKIVRELDTLDGALLRNPERLDELSPQIAGLAAEVFAREMGYSPSITENIVSSISVLSGSDFTEADLRDDNYCPLRLNVGEKLAVSLPKRREIWLNKDTFFGASPQSKRAKAMFGTYLHEIHHFYPPIKPADQDVPITSEAGITVKGTTFRGARVYSTDTVDAENKCTLQTSSNLEEAIVIDSTDRMLIKLGLSSSEYNLYHRAPANNYKTRILLPYFQGDHKPILRLHQNSDPVGVWRLVGEKIGYTGLTASMEGFNFLLQNLAN